MLGVKVYICDAEEYGLPSKSVKSTPKFENRLASPAQQKYGLIPRLVKPPGMDQGCEASETTRAAVHVGWVGLAALLILADLPGINFSVCCPQTIPAS